MDFPPGENPSGQSRLVLSPPASPAPMNHVTEGRSSAGTQMAIWIVEIHWILILPNICCGWITNTGIRLPYFEYFLHLQQIYVCLFELLKNSNGILFVAINNCKQLHNAHAHFPVKESFLPSAVIFKTFSQSYTKVHTVQGWRGVYPWRNYYMERPRGVVLRRVAGVHCVHYIEQKDCSARFATGAIWEIPD